MEIRISGHQMSVTVGMKDHLRQRLIKYEKYAPRLVESHVLLKKEKYFYEAEITLLAKNLRAFGLGKSPENIFTAIDQAAHKVEKQLKKYREKRKDHHKGQSSKSESEQNLKEAKVNRGARRKRPLLILEEAFAPKPMSAEEASMQLQIMKEAFLVFRNADTKKVNVVFKREDGNHGIIGPDF